HSRPPAGERRPAALHLLHDLRPEDDARFARRARRLRDARRLGRLVRAVPAVPHQRAALVARGLVDGGAAHRSAAPRGTLRLAEPAPRAGAAAGRHPARALENVRVTTTVTTTENWRPIMKRIVLALVAAVALPLMWQRAEAFCGFYVCKADTKLFNR